MQVVDLFQLQQHRYQPMAVGRIGEGDEDQSGHTVA
jgi:hypothetical protein